MKIGFNVKKLINNFQETIYFLSRKIVQNENNLANHETRISTLENSSSSDWVEITSSNGQEAEITQVFSEIRLLAKCFNANYSVTYNYDNSIFHNNLSNSPTYMICGNPTENNYGCKFKYMKQPITEKQFVCVDSCFNGGSQDTYEFRAWIKPIPTVPQ